MPIDVVLDWDKGKDWVVFDGARTFNVSRSELLEPEFWQKYAGKTVAVEKAHFMPRKDQSVAQIYRADEFLSISCHTNLNEVSVVLLPEKQSFRAREETGLDRDNITQCYHVFYNNHPEITLQRWPVVENTERKQAVHDIKNSSNRMLNRMRPDYDTPEVDRAQTILDKVYTSLPALVKEHFQVKKTRNGIRFNPTRVMSVYSLVFDEDSKLRRNSRGNFVGIDTLMRAITQNPYAGSKAGTARANIMLHWHKKVALKGLPRSVWKAKRAELRRALKTMIQIFRDAAIDIVHCVASL